MKDKFLSIFLAFIRKTFTKERLLNFISDLLDILYERFGPLDIDMSDRGDEKNV
jgi:hypothetical protein